MGPPSIESYIYVVIYTVVCLDVQYFYDMDAFSTTFTGFDLLNARRLAPYTPSSKLKILAVDRPIEANSGETRVQRRADHP
ncbi:hypothetical protein R50073_04100 [Maricurvus nonylphenolicus]